MSMQFKINHSPEIINDVTSLGKLHVYGNAMTWTEALIEKWLVLYINATNKQADIQIMDKMIPVCLTN